MTSSDNNNFVYILMGVCGSGKSTLGSALSQRIQATFIEGDDLHPQQNIAKMSNSIPLDDADRLPWLREITRRCSTELEHNNVVITCSALKKSYRDLLREINGSVKFVHLQGDRDAIVRRMTARSDHFMPEALVSSQFDTLEPTQGEADVIEIDIALPLALQLNQI